MVIENIPFLINSAVKIISDLMGLKFSGQGNRNLHIPKTIPI